MTNHPHTGFNYLMTGFHLIWKPGIKKFVIIPLILNTLLFIGLFYLAQHYFAELNDWIIQHIPTWLAWFSYLLWCMFLFSFFFIFIYTFATLANLIAAPFNSLLAEKVETYLTGNITPQQNLFHILKDTPRVIARQFAILGYYIPRAIFILILFFIPIVQLGAAVFWFLFNAWFLTLQYIDYPTDNHRIPLALVRNRLEAQRLLAYSFGSSVIILSLIPIVNFFVVPAAVAGATKLWLEVFENKSN